MKKSKSNTRSWFNDRALYRQWPFWVGLMITLLPLLFAAWRILSPYELDMSPVAVLFFFKQLQPLIPWFAAVIAVAALLARMHSTVQTEAQIDGSTRHATFVGYLEHRKYFYEAVSEIGVLSGRNVDLSNLYKSLFPKNGPRYFSPSAADQSSDYIGRLDENFIKAFDCALVKNRRNNSDQWLFDFSGYFINLVGCFPVSAIGLLDDEIKMSPLRRTPGKPWDEDDIAWLSAKTDTIYELLNQLAYIADVTRLVGVKALPFAFLEIQEKQGMVYREIWSQYNFQVHNYYTLSEDP